MKSEYNKLLKPLIKKYFLALIIVLPYWGFRYFFPNKYEEFVFALIRINTEILAFYFKIIYGESYIYHHYSLSYSSISYNVCQYLSNIEDCTGIEGIVYIIESTTFFQIVLKAF